NWRYVADELRYLLADSDAKAVVYDAPSGCRWPPSSVGARWSSTPRCASTPGAWPGCRPPSGSP
ncbi:MAG: hypothetical protein ACRDZ3_17770, partial [Acidimicrobiia bacterium]